MSDSVVHYNDSSRKTERSMQPYHSAWMSHWTKKKYDASVQSHNCSSNSLGKKEYDHGNKEYQSMTKLEIASNTSGPVKGIEKIETGTSKVANESFRTNSTPVRNGNLEFRVSSIDIPCQNGGRSLGLKDSQETCNREVTRPQIKHNLDHEELTPSVRRSFFPSLLPMDPDASDTSSRECHSEPDESHNANEPVKTLALFRDGGFAMSRSWPVDFTASTSHVVQHGYDRGDDRTNLLTSYVDKSASASKGKLQHTNLRFLDRDYQRHSAILVCEGKVESQSKADLPESSSLRQDKGLHLQITPANNNHSQTFDGEKLQNIQNFAGFRLSQNQSKFPEVTKSQKLHHGYNSIPKFLRSVHDMETMRICTTVDSVVGVHAGHPRFSQTTHSFFISKKTDFNLNQENESSENSRGSADGNLFSNIHNQSPSFGDGKKEVFQPTGDFKDSEVEENAENVNALGRFRNAKETVIHGFNAFGNYKEDKGKKVEHDMVFYSNQKNESSAETDIMELDEVEEKNQLFGVNSPPSNKIIRLGSMAPRLTLGSTREIGYRQHSSELARKKFEFPASPASRKMWDTGEPSTSRTQSLDMETLLANAEQFSHSESEHGPGSSAKPQPNYAWVKRLKLNASNSFVGKKSSSLGPSREKNNLVFRKNQECSMVNSEPISVDRHHGKELMVINKTTALSRHDGESFSAESSKSRDSLLSYSWIRRWCHDQATCLTMQFEPVVSCEPKSSKLELEDFQKKQFPSIAAMALMGKAMRGFKPCQFKKKGSLVVWN